MKRVLIITYYWPPNGGAGVQRWLKFVKYLPQHGWQPVVYTPEDAELIVLDPDGARDVPKEAEVIKRPIREPYSLYKWITGRKGEKVHTGFLSETKDRSSVLDRLAVWVRGNLFIPDARVGWVRPSVRFLQEYLKDHPVDLIVSTGPPHSMHLIAMGLKRRMELPWIADFRDPWTNIDFYHQLKLTARADAKHRQLERDVLSEADLTLSVGWSMGEELKALGARRVEVITNGFDPDDLPETRDPASGITLTHVGTMNAARNAPELWRTLSTLCQRDPGFAAAFRLRLLGAVDHSVLQGIEDSGLAGQVERVPHVDHRKAMEEMQRASALLLVINDTPNAKGILTSKLFEYLATGKPMVAVAPKDGDAARVLKTTSALLVDHGELVDPDTLLAQLKAAPSEAAADRYSRKELTGRLVELMNELAG
ncbi:MAG: glycosyltransferase [Flavobacteriales bacterium]|nr:glycosyltransferase [Flavobacteriales bacterium]